METMKHSPSLSWPAPGAAKAIIKQDQLVVNYPTGQVHTLTLAVSDGIETLEKEIIVLTFNPGNITSFYADVNGTMAEDEAILYATLQGLLIGSEESDGRYFRPYQEPTWPEVLNMLVNAAAARGKITIPTDNLLKAPGLVPPWLDKYYTAARLVDGVGEGLDLTATTHQ